MRLSLIVEVVSVSPLHGLLRDRMTQQVYKTGVCVGFADWTLTKAKFRQIVVITQTIPQNTIFSLFTRHSPLVHCLTLKMRDDLSCSKFWVT